MKIQYVIIHCADTPNGATFTANDIDAWHKERGFERVESIAKTFNPDLKHIGYQFVILPNGDIETGRAVGEVGAHCAGSNSNSIGVCMIGKDKFTIPQWTALTKLIKTLQVQYNNSLQVRGHYQFDSAKAQGKTCPNFDAQDWYNKGMGQCGGHTIA